MYACKNSKPQGLELVSRHELLKADSRLLLQATPTLQHRALSSYALPCALLKQVSIE